jgi:hypothetical protein
MANKKTSDYTALPGGIINDAWLFDIANAGTVNYKGTALEVKNYIVGSIPVAVEDILTISAPGQTAFTLSDTPNSDAAFALYLNGQLREITTDYTRSGTSLTWNDPSGLTLLTTDILTARYNDGGGGHPVTSVFGRVGAVTAQSGDYTVAQITGAAASGANSDITSLSGLTTPLSIAQGGNNSGAALTNGKVMQSSGGAIVESSVNITDIPGSSILAFGNTTVSATTTIRYMDPYHASAAAGTNIINTVIPFAATIKNMHVYHNITAGNGNNIVYTLFQNNAPTPLAVTIPSTTQTASNTSNTVPVSAGDRLALQVTKAIGVGTSPGDIIVTMEISS